MNREPHSLIGELSKQDTALVHHGDEITLIEELEDRQRHERAIARLRLLWGHRGFLFDALVLGLVASLVIAFLIPSRYESTTKLMPPDDQSQGIGMVAGLLGRGGEGGVSALSGLASSVLGLKTSGDLFMGVLASRTVQDDIISKFGLQRVYGSYGWRASLQDARKTLEDRTEVSSDRKSGIITIRVADRNPKRAAAMAQEYAAELNRVIVNLNTSSAHRERVFLEGRLAEVEKDLESAEKNFSEFASKNTAINVPEQGKAMIAAAAELEGQLIAAQTQLESLRQIYMDSNVRVRETQARVDELRRQLGKMGGQPGAAGAAMDGGDAEWMYPSIRQLPVLGVSYADLYRKTKVEEAVFQTLTQEYELAKVKEAKETPTVKVLDPANVPEKKSFPHRGLIGLGGALFAGVLGVLWVVGSESWRQLDPQDARKILASEVGGSIRPYVGSRPWSGSTRKPTDSLLWNWFIKRPARDTESEQNR